LRVCRSPVSVVPLGTDRPSPFSVMCVSAVISSSEGPVHYYSSLGKTPLVFQGQCLLHSPNNGSRF
jgi:hypothetical protein